MARSKVVKGLGNIQYVLLNKPKGCITAVTDDRGRPTVMDYLPNLPVPVIPMEHDGGTGIHLELPAFAR